MEKKVSEIIKNWVLTNKKFFWKYEVSSFYQTYKISIKNLSDPASEDIDVSPKIGILNTRKTQLCTAIKKACAKTDDAMTKSISIKVDFVDGDVVTEVL